VTNHPNRGWRSRWIVNLTDCTATHRDGWQFRFERTDDPDSLDGECVAQPSPLTAEHAQRAARIAREAGDIYLETLHERH
jgi:hypothetical protein